MMQSPIYSGTAGRDDPMSKDAMILAELARLLRNRDRMAQERRALDARIQVEMRRLASVRGITFIRVESVRQELAR